MEERARTTFTAFAGTRRLATGSLDEVAVAAARSCLEEDARAAILVFDDATGRVVDVDLRGDEADVRRRARELEDWLGARAAGEAGSPRGPDAAEECAASPSQRGRGRPRLGVVSKEVTLLPRHWAWLGAQRGGASATLRRLVDEARKSSGRRDQVRRAQDAAYRFMSAMGGDLPGYEEAIRALFAGNGERLDAEMQPWPADVRAHARRLASDALRGASAED
jgi:hypothetical protein